MQSRQFYFLVWRLNDGFITSFFIFTFPRIVNEQIRKSVSTDISMNVRTFQSRFSRRLSLSKYSSNCSIVNKTDLPISDLLKTRIKHIFEFGASRFRNESFQHCTFYTEIFTINKITNKIASKYTFICFCTSLCIKMATFRCWCNRCTATNSHQHRLPVQNDVGDQ